MTLKRNMVQHSLKLNCVNMFVLLMQCHYFWGMSQFSAYEFSSIFQTALFVSAVGCLLLRYMNGQGRISYRQLGIIFGIVVISFVGLYNSGGMTLVKMILFALALKGVPLQNAMKYFYRSNIFCFIVIVSSSLIGVIKNITVVDGRTFYYLGFNNPNTLAALIFSIAVLDLCINYEGYPSLWWKGLLAVGIIFFLTESRSAILSMLFLVILVFLEKRKIFETKKLQSLAAYWFLIMGAGSFLLAKFFQMNSSFASKLNQLLSWRPYFFHRYYENFQVLLFGNSFSLAEEGALDNAYLMLLFRYGIIIFLLYAIMFYLAAKWAAKEKNASYFLLIFTYGAYFFMEFTPLLINLDIPLVYFWVQFWTRKKQKNKEQKDRLNEDKHYCSHL